jgi:hypothetical protein
LDAWWNKNPWLNAFRKPFGLSILAIVGECCSARIEADKLAKDHGQADSNLSSRDMLSRYMVAQASHPGVPHW